MDSERTNRTVYRPMLTAAQVAEWLNISVRSVWELVEDGHLVAYRVKGRAVRFHPDQIEDHIRRTAGK